MPGWRLGHVDPVKVTEPITLQHTLYSALQSSKTLTPKMQACQFDCGTVKDSTNDVCFSQKREVLIV